MKLTILVALLLTVLNCQLYQGEIKDFSRQVNLKERYVESDIDLTFYNNNNQAINAFYYTIPNKINSTLVHILFDQQDGNYQQLELVTDPAYSTGVSYSVYKFTLQENLLPQKSIKLRFRELYIHRLIPLPKEIGLREQQYLVFSDNKYFYTPYQVGTQRSIFNTGNIRSYTEDGDFSLKRSTSVKYGSYKDISSFSYGEIELHFENNTPLAFFKKVTKNIEVSHWGNIAIDSNFQVLNEGANLKGEFDRLSRNFQGVAQSALKGLHAELPYHSWGVSYYDEIGNISTSNAFRSAESKIVSLDIRHRFPILGGWKSNFNVGYNLNTSRYIYDQGNDKYTLKQLFSYPFLELVAEDYELTVSLPQGAYAIDVVLPFGVDSQTQEITHSYLDTKGRLTLIFNKKMISSFHNQFFYVHYKLDQFEMYRKPIMIFFTFSALFAILIIFNRLDSQKQKTKSQ